MLLGQERLRPGIADGVYHATARRGLPGACAFGNYIKDVSIGPLPINAPVIGSFPSLFRVFHTFIAPPERNPIRMLKQPDFNCCLKSSVPQHRLFNAARKVGVSRELQIGQLIGL
jgi:hypothetical protein